MEVYKTIHVLFKIKKNLLSLVVKVPHSRKYFGKILYISLNLFLKFANYIALCGSDSGRLVAVLPLVL